MIGTLPKAVIKVAAIKEEPAAIEEVPLRVRSRFHPQAVGCQGLRLTDLALAPNRTCDQAPDIRDDRELRCLPSGDSRHVAC
jgi:hypothetical protein